ncbi:energy-coupling factor transporter ATPase [Eubacterium sp. MSJ-13]|uniref:energy-coupling factor transporter ATPase n=1 Tax=Eubacterium sp. MSJ-13 TaxID=2841513 RepID=UPI001C104A45|nr:energy-coupling factor transporter ATPase [Eubacterium sp. MSJ-13]MBU5478735.1 energy-coupling factor transporter ATPase [Eubacterium sp. MSJ-13]
MGIRLENVNYIYAAGTAEEKKALDNVNLTINDGEFIGLVGHTGSGKSTLTQLLNGLERATSGNIYYNERNIYDKGFLMKELRGNVGLVFQYPEHQLFEVSVIEDVKYGPKNLGLDNLEVEMRSFEALKMVGIGDDLLDASPFALSGGQKRRVAIAGVLAMKPKILILDEPMAGLDPAGRDEILELLAKLHRENDMTILLVSHSMDDVARYVDRMLVMSDGKIVLDGEPRKVFKYQKELEEIGLGVPQATNVIHQLNALGAGIEQECITPEEAADAIYNKYMKGHR